MSYASALAAREPLALRPALLQPPVIAVLAAMTFNFGLCLVNTSVGGVGNGAIIGCEIAIIFALLAYTYPTIDYFRFLVIGAAVLYLVMLAAARLVLGEGLDVKPVRDLLIPIAFFLLGTRSGDLRTADTVVRVAALLVIVVGLFEYLMPDVFTRFFNVARFYIERGSMEAAQAQQSSNLFVSGLRPEGAAGGRNLLPFLGNHRVSSIFLEPVSAGNFGLIVFIWALVRSISERRFYWGMMLAAAVPIVLSDSRFGAYFCLFVTIIAFCPVAIRTAIVVFLPAFALIGLTVLPDQLAATYAVENGFVGRIIMSGHVLDSFQLLHWLGLKTPGFLTADSGYAYTLAGFGIAGLAAFWGIFMSLKGASPQFYLLRDLSGAYFAGLLCISNSPFTIKTGALLWFLMGVMSKVSWRVGEAVPRRTAAA